jgi:hypothetical protein
VLIIPNAGVHDRIAAICRNLSEKARLRSCQIRACSDCGLTQTTFTFLAPCRIGSASKTARTASRRPFQAKSTFSPSMPRAFSQRASQKPSRPVSKATAMRLIFYPAFSASVRQRSSNSTRCSSSAGIFFSGWRSTLGMIPAEWDRRIRELQDFEGARNSGLLPIK